MTSLKGFEVQGSWNSKIYIQFKPLYIIVKDNDKDREAGFRGPGFALVSYG